MIRLRLRAVTPYLHFVDFNFTGMLISRERIRTQINTHMQRFSSVVEELQLEVAYILFFLYLLGCDSGFECKV